MNRRKACRYGDMLYQPNDRYIGRSLDLYGEYSEAEAALFCRLVKPGDTALDVGANVGAHTVVLARRVGSGGRVLAFEPQRLAYYCLCANVALNNLHQVVCHREAVGEAGGTVFVPELDPEAEQNFGGLGLDRPYTARHGEHVPLRRLDDLGLSACQFIKVDVEGMERAVLAGAAGTIRRHRPVLYVEDDRPDRSAALRTLLDELGYVLYQHRPAYFNPDNFLVNPANVFPDLASLNLYCHHREVDSPVDPRTFGMMRVSAPHPAAATEPHASSAGDLLAEARQLHKAGDLARAVPLYRQALAADPDAAHAWYLLGVAYVERGELGEAETALRRALERQSDHANAHNHLGVALARQGRYEEAAASFRASLRLRPDLADAQENLRRAQAGPDATGGTAGPLPATDPAVSYNDRGLAQLAQCQWEEAEACFRQALMLRPESAEALNNLGLVLYHRSRYAAAEASCRQALQVRPDFAEAHNNLGAALKAQGRLDEAIDAVRAALRLKPDLPEAHNNLAIAMSRQGHFEAAETACREALRLRPGMASTHSTLGNLFRDQGRLDESLAAYEQSLRLQPDFADARWNRALNLLLSGDYEQGWPEYEWRWQLKDFAKHGLSAPEWDGSPLHGRTILLHAEQGLGDTVQFVRYAPLVKARGGKVILLCQPPLLRLLAGCPGVDRILAQGDALPPFDVHAPLLSLPRIFGTRADNIPAAVLYLRADPALVGRWRQRLTALPGFKIGIAWQGNPQFFQDGYRSVPLERFAPLARVPGVTLISLQKGPGVEQVRQAPFPVLELAGLDDEAGAFMDSAAVMACLDLVVTTDTALPHLAGALAVPCWLALPAVPDWRWLLGRDDSPWYPTLRLFRQPRPGAWDPVFQRLAAALQSDGPRTAALR